MFNFIAEILEILYKHVWDSYGMTIILLTVIIRLAVSPLTIKSTKSMLEMRKVQPQVRRLQKQFRQDRVRLNQELTELYREHKINPLGGCLPILIQMPIFLVMYQVIRGLTRRASDIGFAIGEGLGITQGRLNVSEQAAGRLVDSSLSPSERSNFNPDWLDREDEMFMDLSADNEMISWGLDLALTPWRVLNEDIVRALPYLVLILLTGLLSYFQQRQIQGRSTEEPNPQQRMIMRIIPIFIPIISFSLPTALVIYFMTTNVVGVAQQAFLTRRIYRPHSEKTAVSEDNGDGTDAADIRDVAVDEDEPSRGLLSRPAEPQHHGSSPLSKPPKSAPPKAKQQKKSQPSQASHSPPSSPSPRSPRPAGKNNHLNSGKDLKSNHSKSNNSKSNHSQRHKKKGSKNQVEPQPQTKTSKRVTPKKQPEEPNRRRRHR